MAVTRVLAVIPFLLLAACSGPAATVDRITIANGTEYDLDVEVTGGDRGGWLPVAIVEARSEHAVREVIDQGEEWTFRFLHLGDPVGELSLSREDLEGSGWRVEVPEEVEQRLQELGRPPSGGLGDSGDGG
jgi:hypothetical protein